MLLAHSRKVFLDSIRDIFHGFRFRLPLEPATRQAGQKTLQPSSVRFRTTKYFMITPTN